MSDGNPGWPVELAADDTVPSGSCLYLPPGALRDVTLPKRLLVSCTSDLHGDTRLVGAKRVQGAQDESAVRVRTELLNALAPGSAGALTVKGRVARASWRDVYAFLSGDGKLKVAVAVFALLAAVAGGIIAFATRKVGIQVGGVVLALVVIAAALKALGDVRDALTPKCRA
jgi:hypothetical protein